MSFTKEQADAMIARVNNSRNKSIPTTNKAIAPAKPESRRTGAAKKPKYRNNKAEYNGIKFDSSKEAKRYQDLKIQEFAGVISNLRLQVVYPIVINGVKVCKYVADFVYVKDGKEIIEDVKSDMTRKLPTYRLKCKLMLACFGISIWET